MTTITASAATEQAQLSPIIELRQRSPHLEPPQAQAIEDEHILDAWRLEKAAMANTARGIKERLIAVRALIRRTGKTLMTIQRADLIADLARPEISAATRSYYRSIYRNVFNFMQDEGMRLDNPAARLPQVRRPQAEPNPFSTEDVEKLLHSGIYANTRMYVLLYAYQGLRAGEIAAVAGENIDWERRRILTVEGKGGKVVWRPMHPLIWREIQSWPRRGFFFPSPSIPGEHVTANNVSNVLSRALKRAGIRHRPHQLRAWFATEMLRQGASTLVVAGALRHSDLQSVTKYVLVDQEAIAEAMDTLPTVRIPNRSRSAQLVDEQREHRDTARAAELQTT